MLAELLSYLLGVRVSLSNESLYLIVRVKKAQDRHVFIGDIKRRFEVVDVLPRFQVCEVLLCGQ